MDPSKTADLITFELCEIRANRLINVQMIIGVVCLVAQVVNGYWYLKNRRRLRLIKSTPTTQIKNALAGFYEVKGTLRVEQEPLQSPVEGVSCAYYRVKAREDRGPANRHEWVTIVDHQDQLPMYLEDETGKLPVALNDLAFFQTCVSRHSAHGDCLRVLPELEMFVASIENHVIVTEETLPINEPYFAFGYVTQDSHGARVLTNGSNGSLLSPKTERQLVDWLGGEVGKAKRYAGLLVVPILGAWGSTLTSQAYTEPVLFAGCAVSLVGIAAVYLSGDEEAKWLGLA